MHTGSDHTIEALVTAALGKPRSDRLLATVVVEPDLLRQSGGVVSRGAFAMALNLVLFSDLLDRVPSGAAYVADRVDSGERVFFDHGALRTIRFAEGTTGALPAGHAAFDRLLEPLGYEVADLYPLPALRMTGRSYRHLDFPEAIPQFFVSELHVERFDADFEEAAHRVFDGSRDPLDAAAVALLADFAEQRPVDLEDASALLATIARAFDRHHGDVALSDYATLRAQSAEAAWIATEGNAFNHATDRVADVEALAERLRGAGRPIKDQVEVSASGRIRQTAFRADVVERSFIGDDGVALVRQVPGSFYEFITRAVDPATGELDLRFDSANATGIFAMTKAA